MRQLGDGLDLAMATRYRRLVNHQVGWQYLDGHLEFYGTMRRRWTVLMLTWPIVPVLVVTYRASGCSRFIKSIGYSQIVTFGISRSHLEPSIRSLVFRRE